MRLIDANEALDAIDNRIRQIGYEDFVLVLSIRQAVRDVKPVDAVPVRHGKWKHKKDLKQFFCDQCGEPSLTEDDVYFYDMEFPNFCPNCGARMDGEHDTGRTEQATC